MPMMPDLASHYNYYIVVILMMIGLYVVFASGNLVKRLVGLGLFQAAVFLFYITIGKVAGGQPPILPEKDHSSDHYEASYVPGADAHTGSHSGSHSGHDEDKSLPDGPLPDGPVPDGPVLDNDAQATPNADAFADTDPITSASDQAAAGEDITIVETPVPQSPQSLQAPAQTDSHGDHPSSQGTHDDHTNGAAHADNAHTGKAHHGKTEAAIYSNPLPHVLILTAIVVGVATLSVGLALVVRIRETYGSIEEADINLADHAVDVEEASAS